MYEVMMEIAAAQKARKRKQPVAKKTVTACLHVTFATSFRPVDLYDYNRKPEMEE